MRPIGQRLNQTFGGRILGTMEPLVMLAARCWRRLLFRTTVIGVTGSVGKTTAKESIAGVISTHGHTFKSYRNQNSGLGVALNILRIRPWHRFAVLEIATTRVGELLPSVRMARPDIRVILNVKQTHMESFPTLDDVSREKAQFLAGVTPNQVVVLNADDPHVAAMVKDKRCRVTTFGLTPAANLQASFLSSAWPERLTFQVSRGGQTTQVQTQFVGEHWASAALASIAVAVECGMSLRDAAAALRLVQPFPARMQPVQIPCGAVFLRDDYLSSFDTLAPALKVIEEARAGRKILVMSDLMDASDTSARERQQQLGRTCAPIADLLIFVCAAAQYTAAGAIEAGMDARSVHSFHDLRQAADFLRTELRPGDLVLLKGETWDHLARLFFAQLGQVACWKHPCTKTMLCDICWELGLPPSEMRKGAPVQVRMH